MADLNSLLLQALTASGSGSNLSMRELLLSQLDSDAPEAALLANYLKQQDENELSSEGEDDPIPLYRSPQEVEAKFEEMAKTVQELRARLDEVDQIYEELEELRERDEMISAALGACYCWGRNRQCPDCNGRGRPGTFLPDDRLFAKFVLPAVQVMKQRKKA